jgi:hypothetical protein
MIVKVRRRPWNFARFRKPLICTCNRTKASRRSRSRLEHVFPPGMDSAFHKTRDTCWRYRHHGSTVEQDELFHDPRAAHEGPCFLRRKRQGPVWLKRTHQLSSARISPPGLRGTETGDTDWCIFPAQRREASSTCTISSAGGVTWRSSTLQFQGRTLSRASSKFTMQWPRERDPTSARIFFHGTSIDLRALTDLGLEALCLQPWGGGTGRIVPGNRHLASGIRSIRHDRA